MALKWVFMLAFALTIDLITVDHKVSKVFGTGSEREIVCFQQHHSVVPSVTSGAQLRRADVSMN